MTHLLRISAAIAMLSIVPSGLGPGAGDPAATLALVRHNAKQGPLQGSVTFDGERAYSHLKTLVSLGPRPSGSEANRGAREWIAARLVALGLDPVIEAFEAQTPSGELAFANVYADLDPATKTGDAARIILATHFDTKRMKAMFLGANDGGSGSAVLLELARVLRATDPKSPLRRAPIRFLFLDGEEALRPFWDGADNCYGSREHLRRICARNELDSLAACVLLDMVGDSDLHFLEETHSTPELVSIFFGAARSLGLIDTVDAPARGIRDDHLRFLEAGIPSLDLIDFEYGPDNAYWHDPADTLEHCSRTSLEKTGRIVLAGLPGLVRFTHPRSDRARN